MLGEDAAVYLTSLRLLQLLADTSLSEIITIQAGQCGNSSM